MIPIESYVLELGPDLTETEFKVLAYICDQKNPVKIGEVSSALQKSASAVSGSARVLEARGYINVDKRDDEPGRPKYLSPTSKGKRRRKEWEKG